jgi:MFS family permease
VGGLYLGVLVDRLGPKRIMVYSTAAWALILLLSSRIGGLWHLYLVFGILGGVATGGLAYVPTNVMLSHWFVRYRGLAAGLSQSGVMLGAAIFSPLAARAITALGWRTTYLVFGVMVACIAVPLLALVLRDNPGQLGLHPDGIKPAAGGAGGEPHLSGALFTGPGYPHGYWTIFGANILRGVTMNGFLVHQVAYLVDVGYTRLAAASFASVVALFAVAGGFAGGAICDRLSRPRTYALLSAFYVVGFVSLLLLRGPTQHGLVWLSVVTAGLAMGGVGPVFAAMLTDRLQGPRAGFLIGLQNIAYGGGATLGPVLGGLLYDAFHSYVAAFVGLIAAVTCSAATLLLLDRRLATGVR